MDPIQASTFSEFILSEPLCLACLLNPFADNPVNVSKSSGYGCMLLVSTLLKSNNIALPVNYRFRCDRRLSLDSGPAKKTHIEI